MSAQKWTRKEYDSWDDAFRALVPIVRQQSVRVAEYTQVIYTAACESAFGQNSAFTRERIRPQFADVSYKCGLYHQLGKALVPPEYQLWQDDFSEEERAVYRKYTSDGRLLVAALQERTRRARERRFGVLKERSTRNIPWLMLRETCEQHMERYDGSGYPKGLTRNDISPIAQIVGLAKELDRLSAEKKLERPFDEAIDTLVSQAGTAWSPELIEVLKKSVERCRAVYKKYIYYTLTLPETVPLVPRRENRPMGLHYRPMLKDAEGTVGGYEAIPWFGGIANQPGEKETGEEIEGLLIRTELVSEVSRYLLYEAGDAALRLKNCGIEAEVYVRMLPAFFRLGGQLQSVNQIFRDQELDKSCIRFLCPERAILEGGETTVDLIGRYLRSDLELILDGWHPDRLPVERVKELGFRSVRIAPELYLQTETANVMLSLSNEGLTVLGGDAADENTLAWLLAGGARLVSGPIAGPLMEQDEMIRAALARTL